MSLKDEIELQQKAYRLWLEHDATDNSNDIKFAKRALMTAIETELTDTQKLYIMAYYVDGLNMQQIADKYGVSKSTVSRTINRGLHRLFRVLHYTNSTTLKATVSSIKARVTDNRKRGQNFRKNKSGT